jgi:hypothetical protein
VTRRRTSSRTADRARLGRKLAPRFEGAVGSELIVTLLIEAGRSTGGAPELGRVAVCARQPHTGWCVESELP